MRIEVVAIEYYLVFLELKYFYEALPKDTFEYLRGMLGFMPLPTLE